MLTSVAPDGGTAWAKRRWAVNAAAATNTSTAVPVPLGILRGLGLLSLGASQMNSELGALKPNLSFLELDVER
jgi:hypothetical protein